MNAAFDLRAEQKLFGNYLAHLPQPEAEQQGERIRHICDDFRRLRPGESILVQAHTTEWVLPWLERLGSPLSPAVRSSHIEALGRWWEWLFQHSLLDDNVLGCFYPCSQVLHQTEPLVLWQNLQRPIACYLGERGPRQPQTRRKVRRLLTNFNVFLHRGATAGADRPLIDERRTIDWLRQLSATKCLHSLALAAGITNGFLRFLVDKRQLDENPLMRLRRRYSATRWEDFLAGLLGLHNASLLPAVRRPRFVSSLAPHLKAFVDLKRAMGRRYETPEAELQRFDRFVAGCCGQSTTLTQEIVDAWTKRAGHLNPRTRKKRVGLVRQFCLYLARQDPTACVPEPARVNDRTPQFTPHIYTVAEFRRLLKAARSLPARHGSLRPRTVYTVLLILYGTGLRIGEALHLRLRDIDLVTDTLMIRDTKFFKSRLVRWASRGLASISPSRSRPALPPSGASRSTPPDRLWCISPRTLCPASATVSPTCAATAASIWHASICRSSLPTGYASIPNATNSLSTRPCNGSARHYCCWTPWSDFILSTKTALQTSLLCSAFCAPSTAAIISL